MSWTAIVPLKAPGDRKRRLAALVDDQRLQITERLADHVLGVAATHPEVTEVVLVSPAPRGAFAWRRDEGRGLNGELAAARAALAGRDCLILFADLPLLGGDDLSALFAAADRHGAAIAPDRHGSGTNAIALKAAVAFTFHFGAGSRALHAAAIAGEAIVDRPGLALDIDTEEDIALARDEGEEIDF